MKKTFFIISLASAVILMATACSTAPAANNAASVAPQGGITVAPPSPTPATSSNSSVATTAPVSVGAGASSGVPVPPPVPVNTPAPGTAPSSGPVSAPAPVQIQVNIQNFSFNPATATVNVGDTVVWTNEDSVGHQLTSNSINSPLLNKGDKYSQKFTIAGTYDYHCLIHPSMTGQVIVK